MWGPLADIARVSAPLTADPANVHSRHQPFGSTTRGIDTPSQNANSSQSASNRVRARLESSTDNARATTAASIARSVGDEAG